MLLSKKDTPSQFIPMWYSGVFNLVIAMINLSIYNMGGTWITLFTACLTLSVAVYVFMLIKRKTQEILWKKLVEK